jgi:peptidoglycan/xylan/chitin deacetylase (PgdA/CDA1 family)
MFTAALTLALCCMVFGLWQLRINHRLRLENARLLQTRLDLVDIVKANNREIEALQSRAVRDTLPRHVSPQPPLRLPLPKGLPVSFDNGSAAQPMVCLSFDGGGSANAAIDILDTLASRHVSATMFLTGQFIRAWPDIVRRIVADGHEVGNHLNSHPHLTSWESDHTHTTLPGVTREMFERELLRANEAFRLVTGDDMQPLWRAPYGERNRQICLWGLACGYLHVGWRQGGNWRQTLDSNDWIPDEESPGYRPPHAVLEKIVALARQPGGINGGIILLHLGTMRKQREDQVHWLLGALIDTLRGKGYEFITASAMIRAAGVNLDSLASARTIRQSASR